MKNKIISLLIALCLVVTLLTGCGSSNKKEDTTNKTTSEDTTKNDDNKNGTLTKDEKYPKELVITYVSAPLNVPSIVDEEKDIIENKLKKIGIDVEYEEITSGADQTQALASGDVHVLNGVGASSVILSAASGADIKVLSMYSRSPKAFCMYSKDKKIKSAKDLKGKTIAGPIGTNLHELLAAYLATENMTIEDVNYVDMGIPQSKAGLDGGSVDVALLAGITAHEAGKQGYNLVTDGEGLIDAIICVAVTEEFYNKYPDLIKKIDEAQKEIADFMSNNEDKTMKIVADELDVAKEDVKEMYKHYDFSTEFKEGDKEGFQKTADFMYKADMIEKKFDTSKLFFE